MLNPIIPGFGGSSTPAPPTHYSDGTPINTGGKAPKSANTIAADKTLAEQRKKAGLPPLETGSDGVLLSDDDNVVTKLGGDGPGGGKSFGGKSNPQGVNV